MPFRYRFLLLGLGAATIWVGSPAQPAIAAQTDSSELVIITEDVTVTEDLYALANRVIIRGIVDGDLVAVAGQDVVIEGEVTGSVIALSPEVVVTGEIGGSLIASSPRVTVDGRIGRDLVLVAGSLEVGAGATIGSDVVLWAWKASLLGTVMGGLEGSQRSLTLAGSIAEEVSVSVRQLDIADVLRVGGDLDYRSDNEATGLGKADVDGAVVRQEPVPANIRLRALGLVARFLVALSLSAFALLVVWGWPDRTELAMSRLKSSPISSFLYGLAVIASPLLVLGLGVLIFNLAPATSALPLVGAMVPVFLALVGLVFVLALVAGIPSVALVGSLLRRNLTIAGAVGLGAGVVSLIWLVPVVGWVSAILVLAFGLGGWINAFREPSEAN